MKMVKETLDGVDADMGKSTAAAHELVGTAGSEKKQRHDAVQQAESALQDKVEAVAAKKATVDESATALHAAKAALTDAMKKQAKGDEELKLVEGKKERLE